jgi:hypothetical protein
MGEEGDAVTVLMVVLMLSKMTVLMAATATLGECCRQCEMQQQQRQGGGGRSERHLFPTLEPPPSVHD